MNNELKRVLYSDYMKDLSDDDLTRLKYVIEDKAIIHGNLTHSSL
jgi:hypothetical protein